MHYLHNEAIIKMEKEGECGRGNPGVGTGKTAFHLRLVQGKRPQCLEGSALTPLPYKDCEVGEHQVAITTQFDAKPKHRACLMTCSKCPWTRTYTLNSQTEKIPGKQIRLEKCGNSHPLIQNTVSSLVYPFSDNIYQVCDSWKYSHPERWEERPVLPLNLKFLLGILGVIIIFHFSPRKWISVTQ